MSFLIRVVLGLIVVALAFVVTVRLVPGIQVHGGVTEYLIVAVVFGLVNGILGPVLKLLTLPLALVTLGLAWFFVAMFILWLTDVIVSGFSIDGFWTLVGATIVVWAVDGVADYFIWRKRKD